MTHVTVVWYAMAHRGRRKVFWAGALGGQIGRMRPPSE